ncbi:glutamine--fructose-6-phosphate transaminase (isomerizing) [Patescibacteria group bacterium]|nr:glutamine--fructose-6-phosphate transaminase (isomerizing) [Patescibacteria group bacterium]
MCGIFGMVVKEKRAINREILTELKTLEYRGYDSWGVATIENDTILVEKDTGKIGSTVLANTSDSLAGIGHTRWATHGGVTKQNAHPHLSFDGRFAIVHNGIIENYLQLKDELQKQIPNLVFKSETDSEVFAHLLAFNAQSLSVEEAFFKSLAKVKGLNAFVVLDKKNNNVLAYRHGSPLVFSQNDGGYYFASDAIALLPYTKKVYFIKEGEVFIGDRLFSAKTKKSKKITWQMLDLEVSDLQKDGFDFFIEKEINEIPTVIEKLISTYKNQEKSLLSLLNQHDEFFLIGCGTAYYAALIGQYLLAQVSRIATAYSGGEASLFLKNIKKSTLPIFLSQSGETIDLIEQVGFLKKKKRKLLALVNRISSTLDRESTLSFHLQAGPEISVVSTKAFVAKITAWLLICSSLNKQLKATTKNLALASKNIRKLFLAENLDKVAKIANLLSIQNHVFVLGRGVHYPIALECALKAKEAAYLHFEAFAGGELKHGVIALIEPGTWTIVIVGGDEEDANILANAEEIKARGGKILGISPYFHQVFDEWLSFESVPNANVLLEAVLVQLLGLYLAKAKNLDPDKPRNLAKSVTVK